MKAHNIRGAVLAVSSALSAAGAVRQVTKARRQRDRLLLVNALANAAVVVTGIALAVRAFRNKGAS